MKNKPQNVYWWPNGDRMVQCVTNVPLSSTIGFSNGPFGSTPVTIAYGTFVDIMTGDRLRIAVNELLLVDATLPKSVNVKQEQPEKKKCE